MSYVFTSEQFINKLRLAQQSKTLYVNGAFGAPATEKNKKRYTAKLDKTSARYTKIMNATPDTFFFDCVCLVKGILWGWNANTEAQYGGAVYRSNGVGDLSIHTISTKCINASRDFSNILDGEFVWSRDFGHCGVYIGKGLCIECTPKWNDNVQFSHVANAPFNASSASKSRLWYAHGQLPWIDYSSTVNPQPKLDPDGLWGIATTTRSQQYLKTTQDGIISSQPTYNQQYLPYANPASWKFVSRAYGSDVIRALQKLLSVHIDEHIWIDGLCGTQTVRTLQIFLTKQGYNNLNPNGILDKQTVTAWQLFLNSQPVTYNGTGISS